MLNKDKYILPSNGFLGYPREVTIRAMNGRELSMAYSILNETTIDEIIYNVIEPKIEVSQLCDEDKAFILHSTRVLTFGHKIDQVLRCPFCGEIHTYTIDYRDLETTYLESEEQTSGLFTLPNGDEIKKQIPTSARFSEINLYKTKHNIPAYDSFLLLQVAKIEYIKVKEDARRIRSITELMDYLANIPGNDFMDVAEFLDVKFGLNTTFEAECKGCGTTLTGGIGITADLFRKSNISL